MFVFFFLLWNRLQHVSPYYYDDGSGQHDAR